MSKNVTTSSLILAFALLVSACAPITVVKTNQLDIASMQPDCKNRDAQLRYLEAQLRRGTGMLESVNDAQQRSYRATVMRLIWEVREKCQ